MKRCPQCKKILFKRKDGKLMCPNECQEHGNRAAYNTYIESRHDRRSNDTFDPWAFAR